MTDGTDSLLGDVLVEPDSQCWQVHVAVDAAELLAGLDQAGGTPAQGHVAVLPVLHVGRLSATFRSLCIWQRWITGWSNTFMMAACSALPPSMPTRIGRVVSSPRRQPRRPALSMSRSFVAALNEDALTDIATYVFPPSTWYQPSCRAS